jgi:hypothetical protein
MTTDNRYNGWTNYETWLCALWMDNSAGDYGYWTEQAQEAWDGTDEDSEDRVNDAITALADAMKSSFEDAQADLAGVTGFWADMLSAAMSEVDWYEIASHKIEDVDKPEPETEDANG